ncbi:hypothetical protein, partial [Bacillus paralicheniformis]|uniref:hypothetical protein n=1 Tax=Bacillus paralicheniformis TaxID=1648923 RepID=UPI002DBD49C5
ELPISLPLQGINQTYKAHSYVLLHQRRQTPSQTTSLSENTNQSAAALFLIFSTNVLPASKHFFITTASSQANLPVFGAPISYRLSGSLRLFYHNALGELL